MAISGNSLRGFHEAFNSPCSSTEEQQAARSAWLRINQIIIDYLGFNDLEVAYGFGLDHLDSDEDASIPEDIELQLNRGSLFFKKADQACAFEERLKSYGAVSRRKRLSWRYRWPDELRDAVLARLLALNAERYEEEQSQGLHGGGYKQKGNGAGKRRSRPAKAVMEPADTEQIGLGL